MVDSFIAPADAYAAAVRARDVEGFLALYTDDVLILDAWDSWSISGKADWRGMVRDWFGAREEGHLRVEFTPLRSQAGDRVAGWAGLVRYAWHSPDGSEVQAMHNRISWTLVADAGRWLIAQEHTSAPASFETGKVMLTPPGA